MNNNKRNNTTKETREMSVSHIDKLKQMSNELTILLNEITGEIDDYETQYERNDQLIPFLRNNVIYESEKKDSVESYLYIKNSDGTQLFFPERLICPRLPSQFLREALSQVCNTPEWNWKIPMSEKGKQKYFERIQQMVQLFSTEERIKCVCKHKRNPLEYIGNVREE